MIADAHGRLMIPRRRRWRWRWPLCLALGAWICGPLLAAAPRGDDELPPRLDAAVSRGLAYLARQQNADGAFDESNVKVAVTSLSLLAFLGAGDVPDLGKFGLNVRGAIQWLLSQQAPDGYFGAGDHGMYAHAITTLALAEAYGVESTAAGRLKIHAALEKAVAVIVAAQDAHKSSPAFVGGWRYERNSPDSDLSLSGWNVLALRAAADVGIASPKETRRRAAEFVVRCYDENAKGFSYQPGSGAQPGDTAIGVVCLSRLDAADANAPRISAAIKFMESHPIDDKTPFVYYATYYATQAAFRQGGDAWGRLGRASLERLIRTQDKDGSWPLAKSGQEPSRTYAAAMAVGALTVPYQLLPMYQR